MYTEGCLDIKTESLVVKHNRLIEARYKLGLNEQKLILYAISKIDRKKEKFNIIKISVGEFIRLIKSKGNNYSEIKRTVRSLRSKEVIITKDNGKLFITGWLSSIDYLDDGMIELEFSEKLVPYLLQLEKMFKSYDLKNVLYLKNKYSIRIYEMLKQYENIGHREFELHEFKSIIGCEDKFKEFKDFKRRVLKPSTEEINKNTDLNIRYETIKTGRTVTKLKFIMTNNNIKEQMKKLIDSCYSDEQIETIKQQCGLEESDITKNQFVEIYEIACKKTNGTLFQEVPLLYVYIKMQYVYMTAKGTARNNFTYLKSCVEHDYAKVIN